MILYSSHIQWQELIFFVPALKLCWLTCNAYIPKFGTGGWRTFYKKYKVNNRVETIETTHAPTLKLCWLTSYAYNFQEATAHFITGVWLTKH